MLTIVYRCFLNNLHQVTLNNLIGFKIICLFQAQWKLTAILLLFDAYTKLVHQRQNGDQRHRPLPDSVLYSALEWDLLKLDIKLHWENLVCYVIM
jgi:hypothetical protein